MEEGGQDENENPLPKAIKHAPPANLSAASSSKALVAENSPLDSDSGSALLRSLSSPSIDLSRGTPTSCASNASLEISPDRSDCPSPVTNLAHLVGRLNTNERVRARSDTFDSICFEKFEQEDKNLREVRTPTKKPLPTPEADIRPFEIKTTSNETWQDEIFSQSDSPISPAAAGSGSSRAAGRGHENRSRLPKYPVEKLEAATIHRSISQVDNSGTGHCRLKTRSQSLENFSEAPAKYLRLEPGYQLKLPTVGSEPSPPRISGDTLEEVLSGRHEGYNEVYIIDCRYKFEYDGGHIVCPGNGKFASFNARNDENAVIKFFFEDRKPTIESGPTTLLVFHCEYSRNRGPRLFQSLRNRDRHINLLNYGTLHYPEMYILEGGYRQFFAQHQRLCHPRCYVSMHSTAHASSLRQEEAQCRCSKHHV